MKNKETLLPDNKWRITLPKEYRSNFLGDQSVVYFFRINDCEYKIYDKRYFEEIMIPRILEQKFDNKQKLRAFRRVMFAHTFDLEVDAHNRIVIPQMYRKFLFGNIEYKVEKNGLILFGKTNADSGPKGSKVRSAEIITQESEKEDYDERDM